MRMKYLSRYRHKDLKNLFKWNNINKRLKFVKIGQNNKKNKKKQEKNIYKSNNLN
jgi:hypothetical protein